MDKRLNALKDDVSSAAAEMLENELAEIDSRSELDDNSRQRILFSVMKKAGYEMNKTMKNERDITMTKKDNHETYSSEPARVRHHGAAAACVAVLLAGAMGASLIFGQRINAAQPAKTTPGSAVTEIGSESQAETSEPEQENKTEINEPTTSEETETKDAYLEIIYNEENKGEKEVTLSIPVPEWIDEGTYSFSLEHECGFRGDTVANGEIGYAFFDGKAFAGKNIEIKATGKGKDRILVNAGRDMREDEPESMYATGTEYAVYNVDFDSGTAEIEGCANDTDLRRFTTNDTNSENWLTVAVRVPQGIWGSYTFEVYGDGELAARKTVMNTRERIRFNPLLDEGVYFTNIDLYDKHYDKLEVYVRSNTSGDDKTIKYAEYKPDYAEHTANIVGKPDEEAILSITPKDRSFGLFPPVEDEAGCTHLTLSVPIPEGLKGAYTFDVYRDYFLIYTKTIPDISTVKDGKVDFDIVGKGKEELMVYANSSNFGGASCAEYAEYDVDYDAKTVKLNGKLHTEDLMDINPE